MWNCAQANKFCSEAGYSLRKLAGPGFGEVYTLQLEITRFSLSYECWSLDKVCSESQISFFFFKFFLPETQGKSTTGVGYIVLARQK